MKNKKEKNEEEKNKKNEEQNLILTFLSKFDKE